MDKDLEKENYPEEVLYPRTFGNMLMHSELTVTADKWYPGEIRDEFKNFKVADNDTPGYSMIKLLITSFDGDIERFYPKFCKTFADATNPFKHVEYHCNFFKF